MKEERHRPPGSTTLIYHYYTMFGLFGSSAPAIPTYPELSAPTTAEGTTPFCSRKVTFCWFSSSMPLSSLHIACS